MSADDTVGFYARVQLGGEVYRILNGRSTMRRIKGPLRLGEELDVPTLFGRLKATVTRLDSERRATAETEGAILPLELGSDYRGCWTCDICLDKRGIARIAL